MNPDLPSVHEQWADEVWNDLEPLSLPGGYVNIIGPDESQQSDFAYGINTERMLQIKQECDPTGVFTATNLPNGIARTGALQPSGRARRVSSAR
jgi:FAD/FMN-containing dehydrogenase